MSQVEVLQLDKKRVLESWIDAAITGARDAIKITKNDAVYSLSEIIELSGLLSDTNDNDSWCAGFMAAIHAMSIDSGKPIYDEDRKEWGIQFADQCEIVFMN
ncbi:hypothetical protein [Gimesia panareensis]|nr:hypothetical protein [Gimesia panareensis]